MKYFRLTIFVLFLLLAIVFIPKLSIKKDLTINKQNVSESVPNKIPTPVEQKKGLTIDHFKTEPVFSPDGNYLAYVDCKREGGSWSVKVILTPQVVNMQVEGGNFNEIGVWSASEEEINDYSIYSMIAWSADSRTIAALLPNGLFIRKYKLQDKKYMSNGGESVEKVLNLTESEDFYEFKPDYAEGRPRLMNFSKDGNRLYLSTGKGLLQIWPEEKLINEEEASYYPLPSQDGFAFFREDPQYSYKLVLLRSGIEQVFKTPLKQIDVADDINISPGFTYVCAGHGASGYYGYKIFRLNTGEEIATGQQYSYCVKWLDSERIVVKETPYFHQWTTQYYVINARTGNREYIDYVRYDRNN